MLLLLNQALSIYEPSAFVIFIFVLVAQIRLTYRAFPN